MGNYTQVVVDTPLAAPTVRGDGDSAHCLQRSLHLVYYKIRGLSYERTELGVSRRRILKVLD